jgi:hypothetical protein
VRIFSITSGVMSCERPPTRAEGLEDVVDHLSLVEAVEEEGKGSGVEADRSVAEQMVADAGEFGDDRADHLAAGREVDAQQRLDGVMPGHVVGHRRDVVHPVGDGHVLVEREMFADFLEAGMQIAHLGHRIDHPLALELQHEPQGGVGRRMLRAEIQRPEVIFAAGGRLGDFGRNGAGWGDRHAVSSGPG